METVLNYNHNIVNGLFVGAVSTLPREPVSSCFYLVQNTRGYLQSGTIGK